MFVMQGYELAGQQLLVKFPDNLLTSSGGALIKKNQRKGKSSVVKLLCQNVISHVSVVLYKYRVGGFYCQGIGWCLHLIYCIHTG